MSHKVNPETVLAWGFMVLAVAFGLISGYVVLGDCFGEPLWRVLLQ